LHRSPQYHKRTFLEAWEIQCRSLKSTVCCNSSSGKTVIPQAYLGLHVFCSHGVGSSDCSHAGGVS
jgi:hypothetical protein